METPTNHEDIDLLKLLAICYQYLLKNLVIVLTLPVLGAVIGYILTFVPMKKFEAKMMIRSEALSVAECDFLLKQLELADSLPNITPEQRSAMMSLSHEMFPSEDPYAEITIQVNNRNMVAMFQKSILSFLESSEYSQKKKKELRDFYSVMIVRINHELKLLDDVKTHTAYEAQASALKPSDLFTTSVDLTERKVKYEQKMKDEHIIIVIDGFDRVVSEVSVSSTLLVLAGFIAGIFAMIIILFLKYFFRYYDTYRKTESA
ncbi:MAG TPA: hypothetical protein VGK59_19495 [Ohtaekwangia sp.]